MKLSPDENGTNGTEDSAQTDNNSHFNNSRPGSSGTNTKTPVTPIRLGSIAGRLK